MVIFNLLFWLFGRDCYSWLKLKWMGSKVDNLQREFVMTISIAWTRKIESVEELVVATDSRLGFGCRWDCCPKIRILP